MEEEHRNIEGSSAVGPAKKDRFLPISVLVSAVVLAGAWIYATNSKITSAPPAGQVQKSGLGEPEKKVLPREGVLLPVRWGDLGAKMIGAGVIDKAKFESLYAGRGGLSEDERKFLEGAQNGELKITESNAGFLLNLFWALGLGTKNDVLEKGPMRDPQYGGAGNFASTGGWTLARGSAMDHYGRHPFVVLTPEQQKLVEEVSKNIYRPCCNNPTYFPDCNHGMAMLGLLELMASRGVSEGEMYRAALAVNAYWFPDTYLTIAKYLELKRSSWEKADPKEILGYNFSSGSGYRGILSQVTPPAEGSGASCGT